jgi:hypothetical protein
MQIVKTICDINHYLFLVDKFSLNSEKYKTGLSLNICPLK